MGNLREEKRKLRIYNVRKKIMENHREGRGTSHKWLIAWCMLEFGTSRRTSREYIDAVVNGLTFRVDGDIIVYDGEQS